MDDEFNYLIGERENDYGDGTEGLLHPPFYLMTLAPLLSLMDLTAMQARSSFKRCYEISQAHGVS